MAKSNQRARGYVNPRKLAKLIKKSPLPNDNPFFDIGENNDQEKTN